MVRGKRMAEQVEAPRRELWPQPIPVIGLTGEYASGKTLFGLTICPGPETLCYDTEKSSESYLALRFERIDVPGVMLTRHPSGYKPIDTFVWWREHVRHITPGRYRVIVLDTASEIESGLYDYVASHPAEFGRTPAQYSKSSALIWGDVKEHWKAILADLASRCETFVFTVHLKQVWAGNAPTLKKSPKGKSTLEELASLFLWMERRADAKGNVPAVPSAIVRKSRLAHVRIGATGEVEIVPSLTPRLPEATPAAIRQYQRTPPDYARLSEAERAPEERLSDDDLAELRARTAADEAETERLKLERETRQRGQQKPLPPAPTPASKPRPALDVLDGMPVTQEQLHQIAELRAELFALDGLHEADQPAAWHAILKRRGVNSATKLSCTQAHDLIESLAESCKAKQVFAEADGDSGSDGEDDDSFPAA